MLFRSPYYPFAWLGKAYVDLHRGEIDATFSHILKAFNEWVSDALEYSDEFVLRSILDFFDSLFKNVEEKQDQMGDLSLKFKIFIKNFMEIVPLMRGGKIYLRELYPMIFKFFLNVARMNQNENVVTLLSTFEASPLFQQITIIKEWDSKKIDINQDAISPARKGILTSMSFFLGQLFDKFLFKCNTSKINHVVLFINFILQDFSIGIEELYHLLDKIDHGDKIIEIFDIIATTTHVTRIAIRTADLTTIKTPKPLQSIQPHPQKEILAIITNDHKLDFVNPSFKSLKSTIFSGKMTKIRASEVCWNKEGTKAIVVESKQKKRTIKSLIQGANKLVMFDFTYDPMISEMADPFDLDPELLEQQIIILELNQNALAIGWQNESVFQALLENGMLARWSLENGEVNQQNIDLEINDNDLIEMSPDQQFLAIVHEGQNQLKFINLITDKVFNYKLDEGITPIQISWDQESSMVHFLARNKNNNYIIGHTTKDGKIEYTSELGIKTLEEEIFIPIFVGIHILYLMKMGNRLIICENSNLIRMEFPMEVDVQSLVQKGILEIEWKNIHEITLFLNIPNIVKADLVSKFSEMIDERVKFLEQFPRETFIERAQWLKSLKSSLHS